MTQYLCNTKEKNPKILQLELTGTFLNSALLGNAEHLKRIIDGPHIGKLSANTLIEGEKRASSQNHTEAAEVIRDAIQKHFSKNTLAITLSLTP